MPVMVRIERQEYSGHGRVNAQPKGGIKECGGFEAIASFPLVFSPLLFLVSFPSFRLIPPSSSFLLPLVIYSHTHPSPVNRW